MAAMLTFYPRDALLEVAVAGQSLRAQIYKDHSRVTEWEHLFEVRPGKHTIWDHAFETPGTDANSRASAIYRVVGEPGATGMYEFPGAYAQRFDGVDKGGSNASHVHQVLLST